MKTAIIRLSAMGDIIHSAVVLQYLYENSIEVDWVADSRFAEIIRNSEYVKNVVSFDLKKNLINELLSSRKYNYDIAIDFQGLIKSAVLSKLMAKKVIGCDSYHTKEKPALWFYNKKLKIRNHTIGRYKDMVNEVFGLNITDEMIKNHKPYLGYVSEPLYKYFENDRKNIIFIIGSNGENRLYPVEKWIELANSLNENILIPYGNQKEFEIAKAIAENSNAKVLEKMSLDQLKATISNADILIGNDTGPSYIAWANNVKNILLFGATPVGRVFENRFTKIIKSKTAKNSEIFDKNDFSIKDIEVGEILDAYKAF